MRHVRPIDRWKLPFIPYLGRTADAPEGRSATQPDCAEVVCPCGELDRQADRMHRKFAFPPPAARAARYACQACISASRPVCQREIAWGEALWDIFHTPSTGHANSNSGERSPLGAVKLMATVALHLRAQPFARGIPTWAVGESVRYTIETEVGQLAPAPNSPTNTPRSSTKCTPLLSWACI